MNAATLVFINGQFSNELSSQALLADGVLLHLEAGRSVLHIPENYQSTSPIYLKFLSDNNIESLLHHTVVMGENSRAVVMAEFTGNAQAETYAVHSTLEFYLNKNACIDYYKLQNEHERAKHHANMMVEQHESSCATFFFADFGGQKSQVNLRVKLSEPHAACHLHGLYFLNHDNQQMENHIHVEHLAEHGTSSMLFKGVLDKKSRALFHGKVQVHEKAQHTNAHQANHNLLLSPNAEVSTQPQLEIYAEDIKCSHGATVGQIDSDSLFYLRSRGIEKPAALKLLTDAFIADMMNKINDATIRQYFLSRVTQHE